MRISTTTDYLAERADDHTALECLAQIGFDAVDFSLYRYLADDKMFSDGSYKTFFEAVYQTAEQNQIAIEQVHSVYPTYTFNKEQDAKLFDLLIKSLEITSVLHSRFLVIHPPIPAKCRYDYGREEARRLAVDFYKRLEPYAQKYGVKIALENMFNYDPIKKKICPTICSTAEEMACIIDELGQDSFVACLDIGHANLTGDTPEHMIKVLQNRLQLLHVHDNDGISDLHTAPFSGKINWEKVCGALKGTGYSGAFSFEADCFFDSYPKAMMPDCAAFLYKIGRYLADTYFL